MAVVTPERRVLAERAQAMRAAGKVQREIAEELGVSRSYAAALAGEDPLGEKSAARKKSYAGTCVDCGGPTDGSNGPSQQSVRCAPCQIVWQHEGRFWTPERIIERFQEFHRVNGRSPSTTDAMVRCPSIRHRISDERIADAEEATARVPLPRHPTVADNFGSWPAAVVAAGLRPAPSGGAGHRGRRPPERRTAAPPPTSANERLFDDIDRLLEGLVS